MVRNYVDLLVKLQSLVCQSSCPLWVQSTHFNYSTSPPTYQLRSVVSHTFIPLQMKLHVYKSPRKKKNHDFHLFFVLFFGSAQNAFNQMTVLTTAKRRLYKQNSEDEFLLYPQRLSATTVLLSGWLVLYCICLLTSLFIYRCLACNHCWHGTP